MVTVWVNKYLKRSSGGCETFTEIRNLDSGPVQWCCKKTMHNECKEGFALSCSFPMSVKCGAYITGGGLGDVNICELEALRGS